MPPDASAVRLGQRLRKARLARNLTQSEVAQQAFSVSYISAVERGQIRPSLGALERLSDRLHVPLAELLRDDSDIVISHVAALEKDGSSEESAETDARLLFARIIARQGQPQHALEMLQNMPTSRLTPRQHAEQLWHKAYCYIELRRADDARAAVLEAIPLAEKANDQELLEHLRLELGHAYSLMHKYQLALDAYKGSNEAIERGTIKDPVFQFAVLCNIGSQYRSLGDISTAIEILNQAAGIGDKIVNPAHLGSLYGALCDSYLTERNFRQAKLAAIRSMRNFEAADNKRMVGETQSRLGRAFAQSGQLDRAIKHLTKAVQIAEAENDPRGLAEAERGLAAVYVQQNRSDDAAAAASHALALSGELDDAVEHAESLLTQAYVNEAREDFTAAEKNFKKATELLDSTDATQARSDAYARFSAFLERRGEGDRALELLKKAWQLSGHTATLNH